MEPKEKEALLSEESGYDIYFLRRLYFSVEVTDLIYRGDPSRLKRRISISLTLAGRYTSPVAYLSEVFFRAQLQHSLILMNLKVTSRLLRRNTDLREASVMNTLDF